MTCPQCGEGMEIGEIANLNSRGSLFWASNDFSKRKICNFYTKKGAIKVGGMDIPLGDGITKNRTKGYVCKKCNFVLIDCH